MVGIIHYNMGNIASVKNAFDFLNIPAEFIRTPDEIKKASHLILPGVGAFPEGMKNLHALNLVETLTDEVLNHKKPFLGICLGMQLLASVGEEIAETPGLNFIAGRVKRLPDHGLSIPHVGWNDLQITKPNPLVSEPADFYFVHSYYFTPTDAEDVSGVCDYGVPFPALVARANIFGTQFHPEKSHAAGLQLLKNFSQC